MIRPSVYAPENLKRVKYAQVGLALVTLTICGYTAAVTLLGLRDVWRIEHSLRSAKSSSAELSRTEAREAKLEAHRPPTDTGGIDSFAVRMSAWARARHVFIESVSPEGPPAPTEVTSGGMSLGTWNATKVRVKGHGEFQQLMVLLNEFRRTRSPVRIEAFKLQTAATPQRVLVSFELTLTVFEKQGKAS